MELTDLLLLSLALIFLRFWWRYWSVTAVVQEPPARPTRVAAGWEPGAGDPPAPSLHLRALVQRGPIFASRPEDSPTRLVFSVGKCAINSAQYGPLWRTLRRNFVAELITPTRIRQCSWIRKWALENHMRRLQMEISERRIKEIESVLKDVMLMTTPKLPDFLPVLTPLLRRQLREAKELRKKQMECMVPLVRSRRAFVESKGAPGRSSSEMVSPIGAAYIDSLFGLEPAERGRLGEEELVTLCSEIINAGTDTSATTVEWALLHLVMNQDIQQKLYKEIIDCVGKNGVVTEGDVEKMPYLGAIVKETFRRHPPSHFVLSHAATKDTELGGYTIPADVNVEFYTAWVTEDPDLWQDPAEFRPERFLQGDGVNVDVTGTRGVKMVPFGAGRRICPAMNLGTLHVNLLIARMIHAFKWIPAPGSPPDPTETFAFTVVMKNPLKALILPR
ncbi:Cytochrome P450 77A1 [Vitis vinifera]|uniref:Cytochrome P450 77A1 n=1 Tax=Vitis vinifera TaxID=29760 RepID=A0A438JFY6_VITVI|nr:Cytochrome P450 77A1 [Vitis vinifera]